MLINCLSMVNKVIKPLLLIGSTLILKTGYSFDFVFLPKKWKSVKNSYVLSQ